jgi:hypothetical protein
MPVGERQAAIIGIAEKALDQPAEDREFPWLLNRHTKAEFGEHYPTIERIFVALGGSKEAQLSKRCKKLESDAYFGGDHNFILEFDEHQHFSSARARVLELLPVGLPLGFDKTQYVELCVKHGGRADRYRRNKRTADFDFVGGRTAQRAYFDAFRDLLPTLHGLRPTVRISEFEVSEIVSDSPRSRGLLRDLIERRLGAASA